MGNVVLMKDEDERLYKELAHKNRMIGCLVQVLLTATPDNRVGIDPYCPQYVHEEYMGPCDECDEQGEHEENRWDCWVKYAERTTKLLREEV